MHRWTNREKVMLDWNAAEHLFSVSIVFIPESMSALKSTERKSWMTGEWFFFRSLSVSGLVDLFGWNAALFPSAHSLISFPLNIERSPAHDSRSIRRMVRMVWIFVCVCAWRKCCNGKHYILELRSFTRDLCLKCKLWKYYRLQTRK